MTEITIQAVTHGHMRYKLPCFVYSVLAQTDSRWKLIVAHDGPSSDGTAEFMAEICKQYPDKVKYYETPEREHNPAEGHGWGHYLRAQMLDMVDTEWIWFQNGDNQICYDAVKYLLEPDDKDMDFDCIYFPIAHSHLNYIAFKNWFAWSQCDMAQFIIRTKMAQKVGFNHTSFAADGLFIEDIKKMYPNLKILHSTAILMTHN